MVIERVNPNNIDRDLEILLESNGFLFFLKILAVLFKQRYLSLKS